MQLSGLRRVKKCLGPVLRKPQAQYLWQCQFSRLSRAMEVANLHQLGDSNPYMLLNEVISQFQDRPWDVIYVIWLSRLPTDVKNKSKQSGLTTKLPWVTMFRRKPEACIDSQPPKPQLFLTAVRTSRCPAPTRASSHSHGFAEADTDFNEYSKPCCTSEAEVANFAKPSPEGLFQLRRQQRNSGQW